MKILINTCYGGFNLSEEFTDKYPQFKNYVFIDLERNNPVLISAVEGFGTDKASGIFAQLKIVEIPDGSYWVIREYDGNEEVIYSETEIFFAS